MQNKKFLQDRFVVTAIDPNNKTPFRNVSRIHMKSDYGYQLEVDINTQIYPIGNKQPYLIKITSCQNMKNIYSQEQLNKPSERDQYQYVSYGVVFNIQEKGTQASVYASFGGLIMRVAGKLDQLSVFRKQGVQARVLLMIRKA